MRGFHRHTIMKPYLRRAEMNVSIKLRYTTLEYVETLSMPVFADITSLKHYLLEALKHVDTYIHGVCTITA